MVILNIKRNVTMVSDFIRCVNYVNHIFFLFFVFLIIFLNSGCKKAVEKGEEKDFDRKSMLDNIGNNIILPRLIGLNEATIKLDSAISSFASYPDDLKLENVRNIYKATYLMYQPCSVFQSGSLTNNYYLREQVNIFPANESLIESNINSSTFKSEQTSSKGFPALDYLLFGKENNNYKILTSFTTDVNSANRRNYLINTSKDLKSQVIFFSNNWSPEGGNYIAQFIKAVGTDVGSSINILTNDMIYDFERILRYYKLGIPLGKITATLNPSPQQAEAYYSGLSIPLMQKQTEALLDLYEGGKGIGFDDYLNTLEAKKEGTLLDNTIKNQFSVIAVKLKSFDGPLSTEIKNNNPQLENLLKEMQKLVVLWKSDMVASIGLQITYNDGDSD